MKAARLQLIRAALQHHAEHSRGPKPPVYLIVDDTVLPKRGKKLPHLGYHYASSQDQVVRGHDLVYAAVRVGSFTAPWDWRCYVNECFLAAEDFRKRTELAAELIRGFEPPVPGNVIVLGDSTFCCAPVIQAARQRGFAMIGWVNR